MADGAVGVSPDVTGLGPLVDTSEIVVGLETVNRQRIVAADPTDAAGLAAVCAHPPVGEYGIVTREALDGPARDAFNRLRVSNPTTLFDSQAQYDKQGLLFYEVVAGAGTCTHDANNAGVDLTVTNASGDSALRQTKEYFRYQPGKSHLILVTFQLPAQQANLDCEVGYGDAANGIFLHFLGSDVYVMRRTSSSGSLVELEFSQADWNIDPMDGTGPSGVTLDLEQSQIFAIDLEWLGVGSVRCGFVVDGVIYYVHQFTHANKAQGTYMSTANLPVRWKIENMGATAGSATLKAICCAVISEGGFEDARGLPFAVATADAGVGSVSTTEIPILAIRPASTFNSVINRATMRVHETEHWSADAPAVFRIYYNPTVNGGAWAAVSTGNSAMEYNATATSYSGGHIINVTFVPTAQAVKQSGASAKAITSQLPLVLDVAGTNAICMGITAVRMGGSGTATVGSKMAWREYR